jgi:cyclophilin family peptidyl-prolyl cis-trans isomerase
MENMPTDKRARQKTARREKLEAERRALKRQLLLRRSLWAVGIAAVVIASVAYLTNSGGPAKSTTTIMATTSTTSASGATTSTTTGSSGTTTTTPVTSTTVASTITQQQADRTAMAAGCPASTATRVNTLSWASAPAMAISTTKKYYADVVTTAGNFTIKLNAAAAPLTVNNFVFLAQHNYYHCVIFHRVITGFVVQGGDPTGTGMGGPGYQFADELPPTGNPTYPLLSVAMANSGANTNGSQFFVVTGPSGENLPNSYSLFGNVTTGYSVVQALDAAGSSGGTPSVTHRMLSVTIRSN